MKKNNVMKKVKIGVYLAIGAVTTYYICNKLFGNSNPVETKIFDHEFDYQEFWLKDGTNAFVHTFDGKIDQVEFNYQSLDTLVEAAKELKELATDMDYDTAQEFEHVVFSSYDD